MQRLCATCQKEAITKPPRLRIGGFVFDCFQYNPTGSFFCTDKIKLLNIKINCDITKLKSKGKAVIYMSKQKKGYWMRRTHLFRDDEYECSNCKRHFKKAYSVCPHCNAKMTGKKTNYNWIDEAYLYYEFS